MNKLKRKPQTNPFIIASKIMKYLAIILTKAMKELYIESYNILLKEIKEDTIRWEVILLIGRLSLKIVIPSKAIYRLIVISIKIPIIYIYIYFAEVENSILKFI